MVTENIEFLVTVKDLAGVFAKHAVILSPHIVPNNFQSAIKFFTSLVFEEFDSNLSKDRKWIENITANQLKQKLKNIIWNSDFIELADWNMNHNELADNVYKEIWSIGHIKNALNDRSAPPPQLTKEEKEMYEAYDALLMDI